MQIPGLPESRRAEFESELRRRGIRAGIAGVAWIVLVTVTTGYTNSLVVSTAILAALYVVPWDMLRHGKWVVPTAAILLAVLYPYYRENLYEVPIFGPFPSVDTAVTMTIYIMMAIGLNIVVGYAGLLDLGYVAFYAMGAYTAAWFASPHFAESVGAVHVGSVGVSPEAQGFHISIWLVLIVAGLLTGLVGILIGLPTLRLRGDYLAIVTLGFGEIMPQIARNGDNIFGTGFNLTNGAQGINPIDPPGFGNTISNWTGLPADYLTFNASFLGKEIGGVEVFYWTALALLLFTVFCSVRLRDSRLGRAWIAIREDETAAAAMGVPLMRTKTWAYAAGAFFGGIAGAYYASFKSGTFPDDFFFNISVFILCMVILGGMGNIWGVILGGGFLAYLNQEGLGNIGAQLNDNFGPGGSIVNIWDTPIDVPLYQFGIFGLILVLTMLFRPEGLIPSARRKAEFHEGVQEDYLYDQRGAPE
ncbi:MAG TPA: branched-chain amino acid ABC transporter permease [Gaiellaceae bacterium]|nr:branched-chain amino acid ABC transporter permease [Gaiellaceae bacterium]